MGHVRIFVTGGTFDKVYNPVTEELEFKDSHVREILGTGRATGFLVEDLMLKDSLYMEASDRRTILEKCRGCLEERILITHGTSTMIKTAEVLGQGLKGKTAVLTGAATPYTIHNSDAVFNLAFACGAAQLLPSGVYIAMNGKIFNWDNVRKDGDVYFCTKF